jgi:hypothetical protein
MNCQQCGAWSKVLDTRIFFKHLLQRRRQCANGHKFKTYEVFVGNLDRRTLPAVAAGMRRATAAWNRKEFVRKHPGDTAAWLSSMLGISQTRVKQLKKELGNGKT